MRCEQFQRRLRRQLDLRRDPHEDQRLADHAQRCADCRRTLVACDRLLSGLSLLELPVPDAGFSTRVIRQVRVVERPSFVQRRVGRSLTAATVALAMSLLLLVVWRVSPVAPTPAAAPAVAVAPAVGAEATVTLGADSADPRRRTNAESTASPARADPQSLSLLRTWKDVWSDTSWVAMDGLADGLTPITEPLTVAVQEIRRTIPLGLSEDPPTSPPDSVRCTAPRDRSRIA